MPSTRALAAAALLLLAGTPVRALQPDLVAGVRDALGGCNLSPGCDVRIAASGGVVTLTGHVRTLEERECVAVRAERVPGVRFLYPQTVVRPAEPLADDELEERVRAVLREDREFQGPAPVTVSARAHRVRLAGTVSHPEDKYRAEDVVRRIPGIVELENAIEVDPQRGLREMEVRLQELFRQRDIPVEDLRFHEAEGRVVIAGRSHDVVAREVVEAFTRELPGGRFVVDRLRLVLRPAREPAEDVK